jgi:hypothetical protein
LCFCSAGTLGAEPLRKKRKAIFLRLVAVKKAELKSLSGAIWSRFDALSHAFYKTIPQYSAVNLMCSQNVMRGVSVLGLILTAPRNPITQAILEQEFTTTQSNTDMRKHALPLANTLLLPQLMIIKINGRVVQEHDFDASAKTYFSPHLLLLPHTTPSTSPPKDLNLAAHTRIWKKFRNVEVDIAYRDGPRSGYRWRNVWGWTKNTAPLAYDTDATTQGV